MDNLADSQPQQPVSLYDILGVHPHATIAQITQSYRKKVTALHPTCNFADNDSTVYRHDAEGDAQALEQVRAAYNLLSSPESRARYDTAMLHAAAAAHTSEANQNNSNNNHHNSCESVAGFLQRAAAPTATSSSIRLFAIREATGGDGTSSTGGHSSNNNNNNNNNNRYVLQERAAKSEADVAWYDDEDAAGAGMVQTHPAGGMHYAHEKDFPNRLRLLRDQLLLASHSGEDDPFALAQR